MGRPILPEILGQPAPIGAKIADFEVILAHNEKSLINSNRKSTVRSPVSLR